MGEGVPDGGAATAYSPAIAIDPRHDYVLHASLRTRQLRHDRAWVSVVFLDQNRQPVETIESEKHGTTEGWVPLRIGPIHCSRPEARWAKIALHLQPVGQQDLHGAALFDDLWFAQMPRLTLQVVQPHLLYPAGEPVSVRCRVSGYHDAVPDVQIELSDALGTVLANERLKLQPVTSAPAASDPFSDLPKDFLVAEAGWTLPVSEPGYYRLTATVSHDQVDVYRRELRLAVAATVPRPEQGEFGWSLPTGERTLTLTMLAQWANQSGIHWIKFPLWSDAKDQARVEAINWFADRLNAQGISLVGLLCDPPAETRRVLAIGPAAPVANLFAHPPGLWYPSLEPVMARLSLKVRWWQLGRDDDSSLSGVRNPQVTVARVKKQLDEIGQNSHVGVVWNWIDELPGGKNVPWSFVSRTSEPALAAGEIGEYLSGAKAEQTKPWLSLAALDAEWRDYIDVPIGETAESYSIDILSGLGGTVLRTLTAGSPASPTALPSVQYTSAQQITDFGSVQSIFACNIYQISAAVGSGFPLGAVIGAGPTPGAGTFDAAAKSAHINLTGGNLIATSD
ncbi:MAG: hypothetical protein B7Z73_15200, partial [Planctomycetia bacterium 21-64-5]